MIRFCQIRVGTISLDAIAESYKEKENDSERNV